LALKRSELHRRIPAPPRTKLTRFACVCTLASPLVLSCDTPPTPEQSRSLAAWAAELASAIAAATTADEARRLTVDRANGRIGEFEAIRAVSSYGGADAAHHRIAHRANNVGIVPLRSIAAIGAHFRS
jgi:hypothetical protein